MVSPPPGYDDRHACVGRRRDRRRHAWNHLEGDALLVQEQRLFPAAIEDERIAPLQPRDGLAFARLLGEEVVDRFLRHRLRRCRADVDQLGARPGMRQQPAGDEVVVDDHVGDPQAFESEDRDQPRIARAGADEKHR